MYDKTQFMRRNLKSCILKIIEQYMTYGYEVLMDMKGVGWIDVTEGAPYPILLRLEKLHYIRTEKRGPSPEPGRKYYQITTEGRVYPRDFYTEWSRLVKMIDELFEGGVNDDR